MSLFSFVMVLLQAVLSLIALMWVGVARWARNRRYVEMLQNFSRPKCVFTGMLTSMSTTSSTSGSEGNELKWHRPVLVWHWPAAYQLAILRLIELVTMYNVSNSKYSCTIVALCIKCPGSLLSYHERKTWSEQLPVYACLAKHGLSVMNWAY